MNHPLKVGDTVWFAQCGTREVIRPCPVCFGKLAVTVILGNDEHIATPCDYCGKGYGGPTGVEREYEWIAKPTQITITGVTTEDRGNGPECSYRFHEGYCADQGELFDTKEEAEARCAVKAAEHAEDERKRREWRKESAHKSFSWHVGYHRKEVREAKRRLAWHEARVIACTARAKTPVPPDAITSQ